MNHCLYSLILFLFFICNVGAQNMLEGRVLLPDDEPAIGAVVRTLTTDSSEVIDQTVTGTEGEYEIITEGDSVLITIQFVGHIPFLEIISTDDNPPVITLAEATSLLEEVDVVETAPGIVEKGDTLSYDVSTFATGTEDNLAELIQRLPGLEINADGSVTYNNKPVSTLLIEGKNILNDQQQLATESIDAKIIKKVEIVSNYKERYEKRDTRTSDKIAMNIDVKEEFEGMWTGRAEAGAGIEEKYLGRTYLYKVTEKTGFKVIGAANNTGDEVMDFGDYYSMTRGLAQSFDYSQDNTFSISAPIFSLRNALSNKDALISASIDHESFDDLRMVGSVIAGYFNNQYASFERREYFNAEEENYEVEESRFSETVHTEGLLSIEYYLSPEWFVNLILPGSVTLGYNNRNSDLTIEGTTLQSDYTYNADSYSFNPDLVFRFTPDSFWTFTTALSLRYQNSPIDHMIDATDPPFGLAVEGQNGIYEFNQISDRNRREYMATALVSRDGFIATRARVTAFDIYRERDVFTVPPQVDRYAFEEIYESRYVEGELTFTLDEQKWKIDVGAIGRKKPLILNDEKFEQPFRLLPFLRVEYEVDKQHSLNLSAGTSNDLPDLEQVTSNYFINDESQVATGSLNPLHDVQDYSVRLSHHKYDQQTRTGYYNSLSWSYTDEPVTQSILIEDGYTVSSYTSIPYRRSLRVYNSIQFPFLDKKLQYRMWMRGSLSDGFGVIEDEQYMYTGRFFSTGGRIRTQLDKPYEFELSVDYSYSETERQVRSVSSDGFSVEVEIDVEFWNKLDFEIEGEYRFNQGGGVSDEQFVLNFEADYPLGDSPWEIFLEGQNILYITPDEFTRINITDTYIGYNKYTIFPGYIVAGFKYNINGGNTGPRNIRWHRSRG